MDKYRVVFHLDEPSKGRAEQVLRNIENLMLSRNGSSG